MELKGRPHGPTARHARGTLLNPFNGIERTYSANLSGSMAPRIHSMELKVLARQPPQLLLYSNPFNGIESIEDETKFVEQE